MILGGKRRNEHCRRSRDCSWTIYQALPYKGEDAPLRSAIEYPEREMPKNPVRIPLPKVAQVSRPDLQSLSPREDVCPSNAVRSARLRYWKTNTTGMGARSVAEPW